MASSKQIIFIKIELYDFLAIELLLESKKMKHFSSDLLMDLAFKPATKTIYTRALLVQIWKRISLCTVQYNTLL